MNKNCAKRIKSGFSTLQWLQDPNPITIFITAVHQARDRRQLQVMDWTDRLQIRLIFLINRLNVLANLQVGRSVLEAVVGRDQDPQLHIDHIRYNPTDQDL